MHPDDSLAFLLEKRAQLGITRIADLTGLDSIGIPTVACIRPNAKHLSVSMGKGLTKTLAKISALMESVEMFHAENPPFTAERGEIKDVKDAISPTLFNPGIFFHPKLDALKLEWIRAKNLTNGQDVFIPKPLTDFDSTKIRPYAGVLTPTTNGFAAAMSKEEAMTHGLYEVIERHHLKEWAKLCRTEKNHTQLDLQSINSHQALLEKFRASQIFIKIWDITSALGIPTIHCALIQENPFQLQTIVRGTAAHHCKDIALVKALTEAAQSRLALIAGARDDLSMGMYARSSPQLQPGIKAWDKVISKNPAQPLDFLIQTLNAAGYLNIFCVDHTKPELNIPVVQIIVPGLRA